MSLDDESTTVRPEPRYQLCSNTIFWADFFKLTSITTIPSSVYSTIVVYYNSYQEFRLRLHYINGTSESIWRGSSVDYACCRAYICTITVYSVASCDLSTHIHHGGEEFLWENWEIQRKARYYFFEGVQGNLLNCGLWIGAQVWG